MLFSVLAVSFWVLQVVQHEKFEEMAENNHQRTLALRAPRGIVFDRDGEVLVENRHSYSISIVREHTKDLEPDRPAARVGARHRRGAGPRDRRPAPARADVPADHRSSRTRRSRRSRPCRPRRLELPDVVVEEVPTRRYPTTRWRAHLFGYVGEVNDAQVAATDAT